MATSRGLGARLPLLEALQELLEALAGSEEHAVEMEAVQPEIGADALLLLLGDIEAQEELAVAVGRKLADQLPHEPGFLVEKDGRELAGRWVDHLLQLLLVGVRTAACRLAPLGRHQVARGAAEEAR